MRVVVTGAAGFIGLSTVREAANDWSINARLAFRTLGDISVGSAAEDWDKADIGWQPNNY